MLVSILLLILIIKQLLVSMTLVTSGRITTPTPWVSSSQWRWVGELLHHRSYQSSHTYNLRTATVYCSRELQSYLSLLRLSQLCNRMNVCCYWAKSSVSVRWSERDVNCNKTWPGQWRAQPVCWPGHQLSALLRSQTFPEFSCHTG